jgi:hypothetical protein
MPLINSDRGTADINLDRTGRSYRFYTLRLRRQRRRNDRQRFIHHNTRNERRRLSLLPGSISPSPRERQTGIFFKKVFEMSVHNCRGGAFAPFRLRSLGA